MNAINIIKMINTTKIQASRPSFDGTETQLSWGEVGLDLSDFIDGYYKHTSTDKPEDVPTEWDTLPQDAQDWISNKHIVQSGGWSGDNSIGYPVVNPATNNLNKGGVDAADSRAGGEGDTSVQEVCNQLQEEYFSGDESRSGFHAEIKSTDTSERIIEGYASTKFEDRDGEYIPPKSFDFSKYNGALMYNHRGDPKIGDNPVGSVLNWFRDKTGLWVRAKISQSTEYGDKIWAMIQEGVLNSFSVSAPTNSVERDGNTITKWPIAEISVVSIPSNPFSNFAIAKNMKSLSSEEASPNFYLYEVDEKMDLMIAELEDLADLVNEAKNGNI